MKNTPNIAASLCLLLGLLAGGGAAADSKHEDGAQAQLGISAVILSRCQVTNAASVSVDCRRGAVWTVTTMKSDAEELFADAATPTDRVLVKQIYF